MLISLKLLNKTGKAGKCYRFMARIFITGSADGLGQLAARQLVQQGHRVVLHARNEQRANDASHHIPGAEAALAADLSSMDETKKLAAEVNALGGVDAIIHNAGVYQSPAQTLNVNTLAPYILTCLIDPPKRLIYLSSGMHLSGDIALKGLENGSSVSYSDSKLHDLILAKVVARKWKGVYANAVDPGWVPTKMGGAGAPDDLEQGFQTQVWLAVSNDPEALVTGRYFHHQSKAKYQLKADETDIQERFLELCAKITGVSFPAHRS
jgi:NAD(P)-dependent dehydrogenase (short-subunit alcohol dehydrogenase family)